MGHNPYPFHASHTRRTATPATRKRKRSPAPSVSRSSSKSRWVIGAGALGLMAWMLLRNKASAATLPIPNTNGGLLTSGAIGLPIQQGTQSIPELPGSMAPTSAMIGTADQYWANMAPAQGFSSGYINFPSGSQAAAALFPVRADVYGSPYVQWAGNLYILLGPDASGNYNATQVML